MVRGRGLTQQAGLLRACSFQEGPLDDRLPLECLADKGVLSTESLELIVPRCLDSFHCECGDSKYLPSLWALGASD